MARMLINKNRTRRKLLASTDRDDGVSGWQTPLFPKLGRFSKHSVRSVFRRSQNKSTLRRGTTSVSHSEGSRLRRFCALSHAGNKFRNVRKAKLIAATFLVNARNAARREPMLQPSLQPRGSEELSLLDEIHQRVDFSA